MAILDPRTGLPLDTNPDEVDPNLLQTQPVPYGPTDVGKLALTAAATPMVGPGPMIQEAGLQAAARDPNAPIPGAPPLESPPMVPEGGAPPTAIAAGPAATAAPVLKPRPAGGAPGGQSGGETKGEKAARAGEKTAQAAQLGTAQEERELGERKAIAEGQQTEAEQQAIKAHYDQVDQKTAAGMDFLQKRQDEVASLKVKDMFEGRPGVAIAAALMEGLGAFAAGLTGGENHAAHVIERGRQAFRQTQLDELERRNKGVANAKDRIELTRMELASREAGMFKRLAADRAANMARFGYDQARIEGDKIYNDLLGHQSEAERTYQSMLHTRGTQEKLQASEIAKNYAGAAKDKAEVGKINAEAAAGPKEDARSYAKKVEQATYGTQMKTDIAELRPLMKYVTPDAIAKVQNNRKSMADMDRAGALGAAIGRNTYAARDPYEGLDEKTARAMYLHDVINQKAATVLAGQGHENHKDMAATLAFAHSDTRKGLAGKLEQLDDLASSAVAFGGKYSQIGQAAKDQSRAEAARAAAPSKPTREEMAQVMAARGKAKPGSPEWKKYDAMAKNMQAQIGQ